MRPLRLNLFPAALIALVSFAFLSAAPPPSTQAASPPDALSFSSDDISKTPAGNLQFHGPFTNETLTITAPNLPPHEFLQISCDLLILHTWDGSIQSQPAGMAESAGPDYLRLGIKDGPTLLYTTFSNRPDDPGFIEEAKYQNYPSQIPGDLLPAKTGAAAVGTLGYHYPWMNTPQPFPLDATYRLQFIVPNNHSTAAIQFTGMGLQNIIDESWGIANVHIRPLAAKDVKATDAFEITNAFLEALDSKSAHQPEAFQTLISGMDATADWLAKNVESRPLDAPHVADLIGKLSGDDTQITSRDSAEKELQSLGPIIEPYLRDARRSSVGEVRFRIDRLLHYFGVHPIDDEKLRRILLATRILEIINTPRALDVRRSLTEK